MRSFTLILALTCCSFLATAQYSSFQTLRNKFGGKEDVFSISTSGFFARTVLWMAGEHDFRKAIKDIHQIRFITIPKKAFREQKVTVAGFKKLVLKDEYEELTSVRDHGDDVTLYIQTGKRDKNNRYFLLIDEKDEVVAMEIKGYVDPDFMVHQASVAYNDEKYHHE